MRIRVIPAAVTAAVLLVGVTCSFPDDTSDQVYVVVYQSDSLLSRGVLGDGEEDFVVAKTYLQVGGIPDTGNLDDIELGNVEYVWTSDNPNVLSVVGKDYGVADVQGESPGATTVRARPATFESAVEGTTDIRVSGLFALDSVGPGTVRYGEKLRFFGIRVGLLFSTSLAGVELIPDEFSFQGNPNGVSQIDFWVPPPAFTDNVFYVGPGFFGSTPNVITVDPVDLYDPNTSQAAPIDLNAPAGPRTDRGFPTLFFNPALFFEPESTFFSFDWYKFQRTDTTQAVTFVFTANFFGDTAFTYIADSIGYVGPNYSLGPTSFLLSADFSYCNGQFFSGNQRRGVTTIFAFRDLPAASLQVLNATFGSGGYRVSVVEGYLTEDRRIGPDRFEEDDLWCRWSDARFANSNDSTTPNRKHIVIGLPLFQNGGWFDSTLTIDNPGDIDWIRFRVQPSIFASDTMVYIETKALPFAGGFDASDIDVYVMRASDFAFMGAATGVGSTDSLRITLPAGEYYLGVVDVAQQPTKYSLCLVKANAATVCTPPGLAGAQSAVLASSVRSLPRRVPRDPTIPPASWSARSPFRRP